MLKIFEKLGFGAKLWKCCFVKVWTSFDLRSNLGLTRGILVILAKKGTLGASVLKRVAPRHSRCSHCPEERKLYFWIFLRARHANWGRTKYGINTYASKTLVVYARVCLCTHALACVCRLWPTYAGWVLLWSFYFQK